MLSRVRNKGDMEPATVFGFSAGGQPHDFRK